MGYVRGSIYLCYLVLATIILSILLTPTLLFGQSGARAGAKLWCRALLGGLRLIAGIDVRVTGAQNIPDGPAIVAANHQSMWETLFLYVILPRPVFVVKQELLNIPIFGFWLTRTGSIALDRSAGPRALKALMRLASQRLDANAQLIIFPEGTRTPPGEIRRLNPGVAAVYAEAGVPCTPAAHDSGRHWIHPGPAKRPGTITISFLEPIEPGLDRRTFLRRLDQAIAAGRPDIPHENATPAAADPARAPAPSG